jgi:hypothetical protein
VRKSSHRKVTHRQRKWLQNALELLLFALLPAIRFVVSHPLSCPSSALLSVIHFFVSHPLFCPSSAWLSVIHFFVRHPERGEGPLASDFDFVSVKKINGSNQRCNP